MRTGTSYFGHGETNLRSLRYEQQLWLGHVFMCFAGIGKR